MIPEFTWYEYQSVLLVIVRITALFAAAPFLGDNAIPRMLKVGLGILTALLFLPLVDILPSSYQTAPGFTYAVLREVMVGVTIGFVAKLLFIGIQFSGQFVSLQMGFAAAMLFDPSTEHNVPVLGEFYYIVAILLYLALGGHGFLFDALRESFEVIPLTGISYSSGFFRMLTGLSAEVFVIALKIAAPVFVTILIIDISLGLVARLVPQMNIFMFGFPLKIMTGMIIIIISMPLFGEMFQRLYQASRVDIYNVIQLLRP